MLRWGWGEWYRIPSLTIIHSKKQSKDTICFGQILMNPFYNNNLQHWFDFIYIYIYFKKFTSQMFKMSVSITLRFDDFCRSNWSMPQMPVRFAAVLKTVCYFHTASPPDFTGNVLRALLKAKGGTTVTLECKPKAYPIASILWKKGNLPIHTSDRWCSDTTSMRPWDR